MFWILVGVVVALLAYIKLIKPHSYWADQGVPQKDPVFILGSTWETFLRKKGISDVISGVYKEAGTHRYYGIYQGLTPTLIIKDPDLIKQMTIKNFDHFPDHTTFIPEDVDPLWGKNLLALKGQKWREMRATLSPSFTSSKMRTIFVLVLEVAENYSKYLSSQKDTDLKNIDLKDLTKRFANDVVASVAFGIKCDSMEKRDNQFYLMGKAATDYTSIKRAIEISLIMFLPTISKLLRLKIFNDEVSSFFRNIIKRTIQDRETNGIVRPDMIHLLMEARKNGIKYDEANGVVDSGFAVVQESDIGKSGKTLARELTDDDIAAQGLIFFSAGFETVSSAMIFLFYELAVNPDIQHKLQKEIDNTIEKCNGKLTYEILLAMKYLDMVVSETLRKWPVAIAIDRIAERPYVIHPDSPDERPVFIKKGDVIWVPVIGIHRDPKYYPNPDTFDPERFSDENKSNIKPYTYMPFGIGPRNCIGSRFALLEIKIFVFHLLSRFDILPTEKTPIPLKISKTGFNLTVEGEICVQFRKRQPANEE